MNTVNTERKLYKIIRGTYSRRDGNEVVTKDKDGQVLSKKRAHVIYQAKTDADPHARDEVFLSDLEAFRFGLARLKPLGRRDVKTVDIPSPEADEGGPVETVDETQETIKALIAEGEASTGMSAAKKWREKVVNSDLFENVPAKKADILDALNNLLRE